MLTSPTKMDPAQTMVASIPAKQKKKDRKPQPPRPHIVVEYKGEINLERVEQAEVDMDKLVDKFENITAQVLPPNEVGMIKKRKLEADLLLLIENMRDLMWTTVKGDKRELDVIFGGECVRIGKVFYLMEQLGEVLTQIVLGDSRWANLREVANVVKEVLESMGHFKAWRPDQVCESSSSSDEEVTEEERQRRYVNKLLKIVPKRTLADFATIDDITTVEDLLNIKVDMKYQYRDWMIWMVHRVFLNDPTLSELNFMSMTMPLPSVEKRVAPKLCKSLAHNTYLKQLYLQNSGLQSAEAELLGKSLKANKTLIDLNIEGNFVDVSAMILLASSLAENRALEVFRIAGQQVECNANRGLGQKFEETLGTAIMRNDSILKIGADLYNSNWRDVLDRKLIRNNDRKKRMERKKLNSAKLSAQDPGLFATYSIVDAQGKKIMRESSGSTTNYDVRETTVSNTGRETVLSVSAPAAQETIAPTSSTRLETSDGRSTFVNEANGHVVKIDPDIDSQPEESVGACKSQSQQMTACMDIALPEVDEVTVVSGMDAPEIDAGVTDCQASGADGTAKTEMALDTSQKAFDTEATLDAGGERVAYTDNSVKKIEHEGEESEINATGVSKDDALVEVDVSKESDDAGKNETAHMSQLASRGNMSEIDSTDQSRFAASPERLSPTATFEEEPQDSTLVNALTDIPQGKSVSEAGYGENESDEGVSLSADGETDKGQGSPLVRKLSVLSEGGA